jgi:hypothetical protein
MRYKCVKVDERKNLLADKAIVSGKHLPRVWMNVCGSPQEDRADVGGAFLLGFRVYGL